jgi:hypothetical protein
MLPFVLIGDAVIHTITPEWPWYKNNFLDAKKISHILGTFLVSSLLLKQRWLIFIGSTRDCYNQVCISWDASSTWFIVQYLLPQLKSV